MGKLSNHTGIVRQPEISNSRKLLNILRLKGKWNDVYFRAHTWPIQSMTRLHAEQWKCREQSWGEAVAALEMAPRTTKRGEKSLLPPLSVLVSPHPTWPGAIYKGTCVTYFPVQTNPNKASRKWIWEQKGKRPTKHPSMYLSFSKDSVSVCAIPGSTFHWVTTLSFN